MGADPTWKPGGRMSLHLNPDELLAFIGPQKMI